MDPEHIDKLIAKSVSLVSTTQKYQTKLFYFLCLVWMQIAFNSLINPMVFTNPLLYCDRVKTTQAEYCHTINKQQSEYECQYMNDFTGTYYGGLYCQNRDIRMTLQSIFAIGSVIGGFAIPAISDVKGRWTAMNYSLLSMLAGNLSIFIGIFYHFYMMIAVGQFLSGFGSIAAAVISYSINSDFFSDNLREKAVIYYCAVWGMTDMSILVVYYLVPYWLFYVVCLLIVPITCIYVYFRVFFLDSPYSLINTKSDFVAARLTIQELAEINNANAQDLNHALQLINQAQKTIKSKNRQNDNQLSSLQKQQIKLSQTLGIILRNSKYLKAVICLTFMKMSYYSFYYGVQGCLERTGFNFGISVFLLGLGQFTGYMTGTKFIPQMKRKTILIFTNIVVALMGLLFMTNAIQQSPFLASILLYLCYTFSSHNFSAMSLLQTESFSSKIRSTAVGIQFALSMLIRIVIPFGIGFLNEKNIHPIIASSFLVIFLGLSPTFLIEETYGYREKMALQERLVKSDHQIQMQTKTSEKFGKKFKDYKSLME